MANSTITMVTSITMIILFTIAIIGFAIGFANDNDAAIRIDDDPNISSLSSGLSGGARTFRGDTGDTYASIINTTIEPGSDVIKSPAAFILTWGNLFTTLGIIFDVVNKKLFGGNPAFGIFVTTLIVLLGFTFTLYIIKAWRGNP